MRRNDSYTKILSNDCFNVESLILDETFNWKYKTNEYVYKQAVCPPVETF